MDERQRTLRDRVLLACPDIDPMLLTQIAGAEVLASSKTTYAAGNGKFPRWSVDRWLQITIFCMSVISGIFFFGGQWSGVKKSVEDMATAVSSMHADMESIKTRQWDSQNKLDALKKQIETIEKSDEYYRTHPRPRPMFPEDAR